MTDTAQPTDDFVGVTIAGRYRIVSRLGAGGMGTAYRAWDEQAGVPVVIKVPKKTFLEDPKFAERFHREIRLLQGLDHPHVVPIVDVGDHDGLPCVAMRFLPGGSLSHRRLRDETGKVRPNPPGMLHLWLPAVAEALDYVHDQGVVHRDVKPGNIFFDAYWNAFLGDFGIAKIVAESETFDREHTLTATHMGIGTPEYMAPEQFAPKAVIDGRTDQYALAVIVYELLAGTRPFTGTTANLVVEVTMLEVPPLSTKRRDLQGSLIEAVRRGLAKKPDERFATCRDFAAAVLRDVPLMQDDPGVARLLCPACENILKLSAAAAGKKGRCPRCRKEIEAAADLSAFWLTSEERGGTGPAGGGEHESASYSGTDPQDWSLLTPGPVTVGTPKQNFLVRVWQGMDPAVRWTTLAAAALMLAVVEAVIVYDWSTAGLKREVDSLRAGLRKSQTEVQELRASNQTLQRENARLADSSNKPADSGTAANSLIAPPAKESPAETPLPEPLVAGLSVPEKKSEKVPDPVFQLSFNGDWSHAQTMQGLRKVNVFGNPKVIDGASGTGLHLGMDSHLEIDLTDVLPLGNVARTTAMWVRTHRLSQQNLACYLCYGAYRERYDSWDMSLGSDTYHFCGGGRDCSTGKKPTLGVWEHLAYVRRDDTTELWVNGILSGKAIGSLNTGGSTLLLGKNRWENRKIEADIDEVGIWDVALQPDEIRNLFEGARQPQPASEPPRSSPPPAIAPFDATEARKHQEAWAKHLGTQVETTNSIGQTFVMIPAGTFTMGDDSGGDTEKPSHQATITERFCMGVYEVTNAQWKRVMGSVPSNWKDDDRPVERVSWEDAVVFCRKLSALPEEVKAGRVYRLPTEAEWEYACRAGTDTKYLFGDDESKLSEYGWFDGNSGGQTYPVGSKKPNAWGLYDMHGNVWEWCSDGYGDYPSGAVTDPQGPPTASYRVNRGGGWNDSAWHCRSAFRSSREPSYPGHHLGFRIALIPPESTSPEVAVAALGKGGSALEITKPNAQSVSKEKMTPGMIGRVDTAGSDAGIVLTYMPGQVFTHERLQQALLDRKSGTSNVRVVLYGTLPLDGDKNVVAWQAGGSSNGGVHRLYVDDREVGSIGDDRIKNAVYPLELKAGSHSIKWVLTGGDFGNSHLVFIDRRNGKPLRLGYTSTMEAEANRSPGLSVKNSFPMPLPQMPAIP